MNLYTKIYGPKEGLMLLLNYIQMIPVTKNKDIWLQTWHLESKYCMRQQCFSLHIIGMTTANRINN